MKKLVKTLLFLVILFVSAVVIALTSAGHLIKTKGAEIASNALGVSVSIGSVAIDYAGQRITFENLKIGSPAGFKSPHLLNFSSIDIAAKDLFAKPMVIDSILIGSYEAYYEINEAGNNFSALTKSTNTQKTDQSSPKNTEEPFPVVINLLKVEKGTVHSSASILGQKAVDAVITVPVIEKRDLGRPGKPIDAETVVAELIQTINTAVIKQNPADILGSGKGAVDNVKKSLGGAFDGLLGGNR